MSNDDRTIGSRILVQTGPEGVTVELGPLRSSFGNIAEAIGVVAGLQLQILGMGLFGPEPSLRAILKSAASNLAAARVRRSLHLQPAEAHLADCMTPEEIELCLQVLDRVCKEAGATK